ncbi:MAG: serine/threonine-protein kinase, partial [Verrucomicrobiota bacterium]
MTELPDTIAYCHECGTAMDVSAVAPFTNVECPECGKHTRVKREFGPYTLVRRHAVGGMSMVFAALDSTLNREVALKILSEEYSADERRIAAFEEEARITASFSHPNVVRVLRTGRAFGRFYIAMELVPGGHFEHQIREREKIPEAEMLPLAIEVAYGLKAAHAAGLIHRDVKPGNILLDAEGHAKLVDFGLALVTHGGTATATELWATPYYVPPETVEGHAEDFRSDIYAFGATLYHALAGKPSCDEQTMATDILREAKKKIIPLNVANPAISAETCRIVTRAMAYEPNDRFSSYDELISALGNALNHLKSGSTAVLGTASKRRSKKKHREMERLLIGVAVVIAACIFAIVWTKRKRATPVIVPPPVVNPAPYLPNPDQSAEIGKNFRDAQAALAIRDYEKAADGFMKLLKNPAVQEPTRSWAGVQAVITTLLCGNSAEARRLSHEVADHFRTQPDGSSIGSEMADTMEKLRQIQPLVVTHQDDASVGGVPRMMTCMLAGLKNWEQGLPDQAAKCFAAASAVTLTANDVWASIYQKLATDYLIDYQTLCSSLFTDLPADKAECDAAVAKLDVLIPTLKTKGRAHFNVRAWQLDLTRRGKLLASAKANPPTPPVTPWKEPPNLLEVMAKLNEFSAGCRFTEATAYLKTLPKNPPGANRSSLLSVTELSTVFLSDLEQDLAKEPVSALFHLKSGEVIVKVAIDSKGLITAATENGLTRACKWGDFSADSLITLHRIFVKNPKSESERVRRN